MAKEILKLDSHVLQSTVLFLKRRCALLLFLASIFSFVGSALADSSMKSADVKDRLNRIFYWQIADELKLSPQSEKQLMAIVEELQAKRHRVLEKRQKCLDDLKALESKKSGASAEALLKTYREALMELSSIDAEEFDRLKTLLGSEALARFYLVRESVAEKVREALKNTESSTATPSKK